MSTPRPIRTLTDLRDDSNLILGILTEVSLTPSSDFLPPLRDRFTASSYSSRKAAKDLGDGAKALELRAALEALLAYGKPNEGIFWRRGNELELTAQGLELSAATQSETAALAAEVQEFVKRAQEISSSAVKASRDAISKSQIALLRLDDPELGQRACDCMALREERAAEAS